MGFNRVNRGGSWNNNANNCRVANRNNNNPDNSNNNIGFRLVHSSKQDGFLFLNRSMSYPEWANNKRRILVSRFISNTSILLLMLKPIWRAKSEILHKTSRMFYSIELKIK